MEKRKTSILKRITVMSWLVAVISVAIFALCMIRYQSSSIHEELKSRARILATNLEENLNTAMMATDFPSISEGCGRMLMKNPDVSFVAVTTIGGATIVTYRQHGEERMEGPLQLNTNWSMDSLKSREQASLAYPDIPQVILDKCFIYSRLCVAEGTDAGQIHLGMDLSSVDQNVRGVYTATGLVGTLTLFIGVVGAWFFARKLTQPLQSLQSFAGKVASGALNARAKVETGDEIGDLAESINRMVQALETNQQRLRETVKTEAAAREKEILLREIHHRVKNNMQILTSLLRLQSRRANSEELRTVLLESESRIRSMGLLHEKLYQSESVSTIDMNGYLRTLTNELLRVNTPAGKRREVRLNVTNINLGMDTALPCGLIATELVSNALKYAFPDHPEGIIYVSISSEKTGEYSLVVWDNGVGVPEGFDMAKSESLGMRLVTMLTDQLNGTCSYGAQQGTRWEIKFQESQYKIRI